MIKYVLYLIAGGITIMLSFLVTRIISKLITKGIIKQGMKISDDAKELEQLLTSKEHKVTT